MKLFIGAFVFSVGAVNREGGAHAPSNGVLGGLGFWVLVFTILGK